MDGAQFDRTQGGHGEKRSVNINFKYLQDLRALGAQRLMFKTAIQDSKYSKLIIIFRTSLPCLFRCLHVDEHQNEAQNPGTMRWQEDSPPAGKQFVVVLTRLEDSHCRDFILGRQTDLDPTTSADLIKHKEGL